MGKKSRKKMTGVDEEGRVVRAGERREREKEERRKVREKILERILGGMVG